MSLLIANRSKYFSLCIVVIFAIMIWGPLLQMWSGFFPEQIGSENRSLVRRPEVTRVFSTGFAQFLSDYDKYFSDNFGFRKQLIQLNTIANIKYLGNDQPISQVLVGADGWLFYRVPPDGQNTMDNRKPAPFSKSQLLTIRKRLETEYNRLRAEGIHYVVVVAPDKQTIYPEYLPSRMAGHSVRPTRLDQVLEFMKASPVPVLDLRPSLKQAKNFYLIYYKTDTHWNKYGGYIAYREIIRHLAKDFPDLSPVPLSDFKLRVQENNGFGDLAGMLSMSGMTHDVEIKMIRKQKGLASDCGGNCAGPGTDITTFYCAKETPLAHLPKLLMYHDSFLFGMLDYIPENFSRSVFAHSHTRKKMLQMIEEAKPDIVILEVVERFLPNLLE